MKIMVVDDWVDASVLASNIAEPDTGEVAYNVGTTYALNALAYDATTHLMYRSLIASNLGNALTDATKWLWVGSTNRWGMFDQVVGSASTRATPLTVTVKFSRCTTLAILGMAGTTLTLTQRESGGGAIIGSVRTITLPERFPPFDWASYFFTLPERADQYIVFDFVPVTNSELTVSLSSPSGNVSIGTLLVGAALDIGMQKYGASAGFKSYRTVNRDAVTGLTTIKAGPTVKEQNSQVIASNSQVDAVMARLYAAYEKRVLVAGDGGFNTLAAYGILTTARVDLSTPALSYITITHESLT